MQHNTSIIVKILEINQKRKSTLVKNIRSKELIILTFSTKTFNWHDPESNELSQVFLDNFDKTPHKIKDGRTIVGIVQIKENWQYSRLPETIQLGIEIPKIKHCRKLVDGKFPMGMIPDNAIITTAQSFN